MLSRKCSVLSQRISPQLQCGFTYPIATEDAVGGFEIGFEIDGYIYVVAKVSAR